MCVAHLDATFTPFEGMGRGTFFRVSKKGGLHMIENDRQRWLSTLEKVSAFKLRGYLSENSMALFLREESLFRFDPEGQISSGEFYALYRSWCMEQKILPEPMRNFCVYLKRNEEEDPIAPSSSILTENKRYVRGFRGIRGLTEQEQREHTSDTSIKYSDELEKKRVVCVHV